MPVLGAVPGSGDTAGSARACGVGQPRSVQRGWSVKAPLRRHLSGSPNDQKEGSAAKLEVARGPFSASRTTIYSEEERDAHCGGIEWARHGGGHRSF